MKRNLLILVLFCLVTKLVVAQSTLILPNKVGVDITTADNNFSANTQIRGNLVVKPTTGLLLNAAITNNYTLPASGNGNFSNDFQDYYIYDPGGPSGNYVNGCNGYDYSQDSPYAYRLTFEDLDTYDTNDYVEILINGVTIGRFYGNILPPSFETSAGDAIYIKFISNTDNQVGRGFKLKVQQIVNNTSVLSDAQNLGEGLLYLADKNAFRSGSIKPSAVIGYYSTTLGYQPTASGNYSTAMGYNTIASGSYSTALGNNTYASGPSSFVTGTGTQTFYENSTAIGQYNIVGNSEIFVIGSGTSDNTRANALLVTRDTHYVGIGTNNPLAPLHVAGQATIFGSGNGYHFNYGSPNLINYVGSEGTSIVAEAAIYSKTTIGAFQNIAASDNRIKNIIGLSNNAEDLARLRKIEITNYRMRDVATWGTQTFKKVIAQQVESVYPEVIKRQTAVIPDIYSLAEKVVYNAENKELSISLSKSYDIKIGEKIELVHPEKGKIQAEVVAVSGYSFTIKNWNYATDKIFVFGREVNDFRSVDYEALSMLGISAIQQLAKENEAMKIKNEELSKKNEKIEARLNAIEAALKPQTGN